MAILDDVKSALGINDNTQDTDISNKILAVKQLADLPDDIINTELGNALIIIGVTDLWNMNSGEIKFSPAYSIIWEKLHNKYLNGVGANES